ncbi:MAG: DUF2207 domain-containing protein [Comamonadaceae bacterium]|nr:DUF2207 domain-containing protein [Comamonadaceae bacterium]
MIVYVLFLFLPILFAAVGSSELVLRQQHRHRPLRRRYHARCRTATCPSSRRGTSIIRRLEYWVRFRDFVYSKYADGYPLFIDFSNVAQFDESAASVRVLQGRRRHHRRRPHRHLRDYDYDEQGYLVECYPSRDSCESIFTEMDDHALSEGKVTFIYEYRIIGAVTEYSDISELNWRLFEYVEGKIKEATVSVHLPASAYGVDDIYVWGHSLASGSIDVVSAQAHRHDASERRDERLHRIPHPRAEATSSRTSITSTRCSPPK